MNYNIDLYKMQQVQEICTLALEIHNTYGDQNDRLGLSNYFLLTDDRCTQITDIQFGTVLEIYKVYTSSRLYSTFMSQFSVECSTPETSSYKQLIDSAYFDERNGHDHLTLKQVHDEAYMFQQSLVVPPNALYGLVIQAHINHLIDKARINVYNTAYEHSSSLLNALRIHNALRSIQCNN